jgi:hypothetical protein
MICHLPWISWHKIDILGHRINGHFRVGIFVAELGGECENVVKGVRTEGQQALEEKINGNFRV